MTDDVRSTTTSRRALLTGTALGAAALVADAVSRTPAEAASGDPVVAGQTTIASVGTALFNDGGVDGTIPGDGLEVRGAPAGGSGLVARSFGGGSPAIHAEGDANGVVGMTVSSAASGVYGQNDGGGIGTAGRSNEPGGIGVLGEALGAGGTGVDARAAGAGVALRVVGKMRMTRSGKKVVPGGSNTATVVVPGLTSASLVFVTAQKHVGTVVVTSATPGTGQFVIRLNQAAPVGGFPVAWMILN